jgi:hypothetical protein
MLARLSGPSPSTPGESAAVADGPVVGDESSAYVLPVSFKNTRSIIPFKSSSVMLLSYLALMIVYFVVFADDCTYRRAG